METIVTEKKVYFKELEKKIFHFVCGIAQEITKAILEAYDDELALERDRKKLRDKGKRQTTIKTVLGALNIPAASTKHVWKTVQRHLYICLMKQ